MITICVPIYNFDVSQLVKHLNGALDKTNKPVELIFIDDASIEKFRKKNKETVGKHQYIQLDNNSGRAAIRNRFLEYARYDHLLFLDCDSLLINSDFINNYITQISSETNVICGGRLYPKQKANPQKQLRWVYGTLRESQTADVRMQHPNRSFMTNNFLIRKSILQSIKFDESLRQYGHEDTLFGYELRKANIKIDHINNPILNGDIETNEVFLKKTEQGIQNLVQIIKMSNMDPLLIQEITLANTYFSKYWMRGLIRFLFFGWKKLLKTYLLSGNGSLRMFDFYKLGLFAKEVRKQGLKPNKKAG